MLLPLFAVGPAGIIGCCIGAFLNWRTKRRPIPEGSCAMWARR